MQNGVEEIYSQLRFLQIRPYCEWKEFYDSFTLPFRRDDQHADAMRKFQALLKTILLRRTKTSKIDGTEIVKGLPGKTINIVHAVFDEEELEFYRALERETLRKLREYQAAGTLGKNFSNILAVLLRLRQACLHHQLIRGIEKAGSTELTSHGRIELAKQFDKQTVLRIKGIAAFECAICVEVAIDPSLVLPCGHHVGRSCETY
jgi:SNF2 family DNA or RNA helicase